MPTNICLGLFAHTEIIAGGKNMGCFRRSWAFPQFLWQKNFKLSIYILGRVQTLLWKVGQKTVLPRHTNGQMPLMPNSNRQFPSKPKLFSFALWNPVAIYLRLPLTLWHLVQPCVQSWVTFGQIVTQRVSKPWAFHNLNCILDSVAFYLMSMKRRLRQIWRKGNV